MRTKTYNVSEAEYNDTNNNNNDGANQNGSNTPNSTAVTKYPENTKNGGSNSKLHTEEEDDDFLLTSCGIGSWRPSWLQSFATPVFFLINMSLVGTLQSMTGPMYFGSMSTLEKRYAFDSKVSAVILIADNFSQMVISPIVGYLGVRYNRSRLIGIGELFLSLSCFISASPYFIFGPAKHLLTDTSLLSSLNRTNIELCSADNEQYDCSNNHGATIWLAVCILFMGSFFRGIGFTSYFVIGFPYLDDNVSKKNSPMYISIMQAIRLIGPACGYMLSSFCLRYYENPFMDPGITRKDPRFVGAWWLGFVIVGILLFIAALPMLLFPMQFKNASVKAVDIQKKIKESGGSVDAMKRLIRNPIVVLYMCGSALRYIGVGGYVMAKTKYIESQFRTSSSTASFITGSTSILPMAIGILLGGLMLTTFKPNPKTIFIYVFLVEAVSIFTFGSGMFLGCDPINLQGESTAAGNYSMFSSCNQNCPCTTQVYTPMCGADGTSYFSPCFAGCKSYGNKTMSTFEDCPCTDGGTITKGFCPKDSDNCDNLMSYLIAIMSGAIISSTARTANSLMTFRSIDPMDKSFMMGIASTFFAIFAFIPYPLVFGAVIDSVCLVWEEKCGKTGNCWVYDQKKFRTYFHATAAIFLIISSMFDFTMIFFSDRVKNFYGDDDQEEETQKEITIDEKIVLKDLEARATLNEKAELAITNGDSNQKLPS